MSSRWTSGYSPPSNRGDIIAETKRLKEAGVVFTREPTMAGPVTMAIFSDTCGNLIQIHEPT